VFAIGQSFCYVTENLNETVLEIAQFVPPPDGTAAVAEVARTMIGSFSSAIGKGPNGPVRILIERSQDEEVMRGTHTDVGLVVELPGVLPLSDPAKELIAHELFHDWLGSQLKGEDSLAWFSEGFTDYLSLWHATAAGVIAPERFVSRILGIEREAKSSASFGDVKFADGGTNWRDGDGPNETLAYRGGALLALTVDTELRIRSGQTLNALIRGLFQSPSPTYQLADIRDIMAQLGIADVYDRSIAGSDLPDARATLITQGFDEAVETASLTYLGIEAQFDGPTESDVVPAIVRAIDPVGPAAKAGVVPGDRIVAFGDRRGNPPSFAADAPQRYRFGLNVIPSGAKSVTLDLIRDGQPLQVEIAPVLVPGGRRVGLKWNPDRRTGYFDPVHTAHNKTKVLGR
jgi:hypothetical protein